MPSNRMLAKKNQFIYLFKIPHIPLMPDDECEVCLFELVSTDAVRLEEFDFFSSFPFSSTRWCFSTFVRRGRRGTSTEELGKSDSDELALDFCMRSRLHTRWMRREASLPFPFSRLRLLLAVVPDDDFDSVLFVAIVPRFMRVVIKVDEEAVAFVDVVRGKLSIDDCDDAKLEIT